MCGADIVAMPANGLLMGSPPRVRSRHRHGGRYAGGRGITSACAEQTTARAWACSPGRDHLRVCGADILLHPYEPHTVGSPPRVRSRLENRIEVTHASGITSACAEQTRWSRCRTPAEPDHLRVCGADSICAVFDHALLGSPPRVRSRPGRGWNRPRNGRITSACAEQTNPPYAPDADCRGSPPRVRSRRERGTPHAVDAGITSACAEQTERGWSCDDGKSRQYGSPPRVRSRRRWWSCGRLLAGITSACAEQTGGAAGVVFCHEDHLRVCGADVVPSAIAVTASGSPPRVRSRPRLVNRYRGSRGITSACAEQTSASRATGRGPWDHLRVCGADELENSNVFASLGSPPRVRSRHDRVRGQIVHVGIASACAEQTSMPWMPSRVTRDHLRVCGADGWRHLCPVRARGSPPRVRSRQEHQ